MTQPGCDGRGARISLKTTCVPVVCRPRNGRRRAEGFAAVARENVDRTRQSRWACVQGERPRAKKFRRRHKDPTDGQEECVSQSRADIQLKRIRAIGPPAYPEGHTIVVYLNGAKERIKKKKTLKRTVNVSVLVIFFFLRISRNTLCIVMRYPGRIRVHTTRTERTAPRTNNEMLCRLVTIRLGTTGKEK